MTTETPDWIKPGTPVVVYVESHRNEDPQPRTTTIAKVAKLSFTVEGFTNARFKIADQRSRQGSTWSFWHYVAVPADSDEASKVKQTTARLKTGYRARDAVDAWRRDRTRENRLAAIAALQAVEE
ncbi:hypothetical protein AB0383_20380 [Amycolatopsis sp. NPDC051373]|uniref:beta barrel domain-containing protein n=1 Tax=Amycolatopsis sp. NPDC051373 TaxID=3155801 RepID=UPI003450D886